MGAFNEPQILELTKKLGVNDNFFEDLGKESDWSFIIKLHAMVEAATTQLLTYHFNNEKELGDIFTSLEMSNAKIGKVAFLKSQGLLGEHYINCIIGLSELRNRFVHNVSYCTKTIQEIVDGYNTDQLKRFALRFNPDEATLLGLAKGESKTMKELKDKHIEKLMDRAKTDAKFYIWYCSSHLLIAISQNFAFSEMRQYFKARDLVKHTNKKDEQKKQ